MKTHYTAKELAGMPGLPGTERAVQMKAERENWPSQKRAGRGGGREYSLFSLPKETQQHLKHQHCDSIAANLPAIREAAPAPALAAKPAPVPMAVLPEWQRKCADARLILMNLIKVYSASIGVKPAIKRLLNQLADGTVDLARVIVPQANARAGKLGSRTVSDRTLLRWWSDWKKSGFQTSALVPDGDRQPRPDPAWADAFLLEWRKPQKPALTEVLDALEKSIPAHIPMPSYDQARRYLSSLGAIEKNKGRMAGNDLQTLKSYRRRLTDHMFPGDAYTADGHTFDAEVAHPFHGRPFRPEITPVIDVATRMIVGWSCDLAESGLAVLDAFRGACENFGPPVIFYTDNGKGYKNQIMTAPGTGILGRLGITPEYSRPRNPQAHGVSERAHQSVLIKAAKRLCTYMGAHMDGEAKRLAYKETRKAIKNGGTSALLIEWDDFVEHVNQAVIDYNNRPHNGLPAYRDPISRKRIHYSPAQYWQIGIKQMQRELPQEHWTQPANELPDLYHPAEERTVNRGWIRLGTTSNGLPKNYYAPELAEWTGERVQVAFSPSDSSKVWVRDLEHGRLLAVAKLGGNAAEYFAKSYIEEKREKRADSRLRRLERQAEEIELERRGPQGVVLEHSDELQEKRAALMVPPAEDAEVIERPRVAGKLLQLHEEESKPVEGFQVPEGRQERIDLWISINDRSEAGDESLTVDELRWHVAFRNSPVWKAWARIHLQSVK